MKIGNLEINPEIVKKIATYVLIGSLTGSTVVGLAPQEVSASSYNQYNQEYYVQSSDVLYYFNNIIAEDIRDSLEKTASSTNLKNALENYDILYDFVNNGKMERNTYFYLLPVYEQTELNYLSTNLANEIYDKYNSKSYFKTTCKSKLGFYLDYNSQEEGYLEEHEKTMTRYEKTYNTNLKNYLSQTKSESTLKKALKEYKKLIDFIKGNTRSDGYIFKELTLTEQNNIINLLNDWTYRIEAKYENTSYYSRSCVSVIGWTVNNENVLVELGEYISVDNTYNPIYSGISYNHQTVMTYFTNTQNNLINNYLLTLNETNLSYALDVYSTLWKFIKGEVSVYNYTYSNLTTAEKQTLINLITTWTQNIINKYGNYENYKTLCKTKVGWLITLSDFNRELTALNQTPVISIPNPNTNTQVPTVPSVPTVQIPVQTVPGNNTPTKNWQANYANPSVNTSRGESDWTPENVEDIYNDDYRRNTQGYYDQYGNFINFNGNSNMINNYGYYDQYGNYIPFNNGYEDEHTEDYVPTYIPR